MGRIGAQADDHDRENAERRARPASRDALHVEIDAISSVPTLFEQDPLLIGNALNVVGHDLRK